MRARKHLAVVGLTAMLATFGVLGPTTPAAHGADSDVYGLGSAVGLGAADAINRPLVTMAATPAGTGYWLAASDGGIFSYNAPFFGSTGGMRLNQPIIDMTPTPTGNGYWMVATDGGVFSFGDAIFWGSTGGMVLNQPVASIAASPSGHGYWLVAKDGGIFAFGDARYFGSLPGSGVRASVVDMIARPQGDGYWIVDQTGGVYSYGAAPFYGSLPSIGAHAPGRIVGGAATAAGDGYWLVSSDGSVYAFGAARYLGGVTPVHGQRVVAIAAKPDGTGYWIATSSGLLPVRPGDRSTDVLALQQRLTELGYWMPTPDGSYGSLTSQAVMAFQKYSGLPRSGVADQRTVDALLTADPPRAASSSGDLVEIDKGKQLLFVVRGGHTVKAINVSTGSGIPFTEHTPDGRTVTGDAQTPPGRFKVTRGLPDGWRQSDLGLLWRPKYFNGGIAVHGSLSIPGYPASHGCVRVSTAAMDWIWATDTMPNGSAVWVHE